jgi:hypothetical protein
MKSGVVRRVPEEAGAGGYNTLFVFDRISPKDARGFVTEELAGILTAIDQQVEKSSVLAMVNGIVKAGKIIPSPATQARNALSLIPMLFQAGTFPVLESTKAAGKASKAFAIKTMKKGRASEELMRDMTRAHELHLIGTGALSGEAEIWVKQAQNLMGTKVGKAIPQAPKRGKDAWNFMRRAYTGIDDWGKFYGWQVYRERLTDRLVKDAADLDFMEKVYGSRDIEEAAANIVKDTLQHFPRTAPLGKSLARQPLFGTFVSFPLEMSRNLVNSVRFAAHEISYGMASGKTRWVMQGGSRLAGITAGALGFAAAGDYSAKKMGLDRSKMEAFRKWILPPWAKNNEIAFMGREGTEYNFLDMGYANPYSEVLELIQAALVRPTEKPGDLPERLMRVAEQIEDVLMGTEIAAGAFIGAAMNKRLDENLVSGLTSKKESRRIVNPEDPEQLQERLYYLLRQTSPGALVSAERLAESLSGKRAFGLLPEKPRFKSYEPEAEVLALFGMPRMTSTDVSVSMRFHVNDLREQWNNFGQLLRSDLRAAPTIGDEDRAVEALRPVWDEKLQSLGVMRRDALNLGISHEQWEEMVSGLVADRNLGFRKDVRQAIVDGRPVDILEAFPFLEK